MSVESVARSTSITTVSRPMSGHTEVSGVCLGPSREATPPLVCLFVCLHPSQVTPGALRAHLLQSLSSSCGRRET